MKQPPHIQCEDWSRKKKEGGGKWSESVELCESWNFEPNYEVAPLC